MAGDGGTATVALSAIPTTLNDHTVAGDTDATQLVASTTWVQVFQIGGPALKPTLDTEVIQSAEVVSVNPQTVVYQIAPKAVWSDGVPITAADFQYAWQSQRGGATDIDGAPDSVASTLGYRDILSVASSNSGRTVTVTFRTPYADWESLFDDLLPAHIAEQVGWNHGFDHFDPHVLVSAGPWVIKKWIPGQEVVLERNPHWWGTLPRFRRDRPRGGDQSHRPGPRRAHRTRVAGGTGRVRRVVAVAAVVSTQDRNRDLVGDDHAPAGFQRPSCAPRLGGRPPGHRSRHRPCRYRRPGYRTP